VAIDNLVSQLVRDEGFVPHAYTDSLGYLTIGIGFMIDRRKGGRIPYGVALSWLDFEISRIRTELSALWRPFLELDPVRQEALVNMAYNLGTAGVIGFKKTLALLAKGEYDGAADEMLRSRWASQVGKRALRLSEQVRTGERQ